MSHFKNDETVERAPLPLEPGIPHVRWFFYETPRERCPHCETVWLQAIAVAPTGGTTSVMWVLGCPVCDQVWHVAHTNSEQES